MLDSGTPASLVTSASWLLVRDVKCEHCRVNHTNHTYITFDLPARTIIVNELNMKTHEGPPCERSETP